MQCIVFFGIQGSGKGTQAELLSHSLNFQHINTGDLFRDQVSRGTELGLRVREIIGRGELVPDELVFQIVDSVLEPERKGIVFDGFPRTLAQAEFLVRHYEVLRVFFLQLEEADAINRISARRVCGDCGTNYNLKSNRPQRPDLCDKCGGALIIRKDDRPEAISKRFAEFYSQTLALKDFFGEQGLLTEINAGNSIDAIAGEIANTIGNLNS